MGNHPNLSTISHFKKSILPCVWSFFFGIALWCSRGKCFGLDKAKLEVYHVIVGLYYGLKVDYASLFWEEFGNSISHSKMENGVSSARFCGMIFREVYTQEGVLFPSDIDTNKFPPMTVPKFVMDDAMLFPMVA